MSIVLSNFCKIKKADIEIGGLTVIAGPNDTGKSTIGKALYATIKSQVGFPDFYNKIHNRSIISKLLNPFFSFIGSMDFNNNDPASQELLKELSDLRFRFFIADQISNPNDDKSDSLIKNVFDIVTRCKNKFKLSDEICKPIFDIQTEYNNTVSDEKKFKNIAEYYFKNTFSNNINNSVHKEKTELSFSFKGNVISKLSIENNTISQAQIDKEKNFLSFTDVTFIDSPLYLERSHDSEAVYIQDLKQKINSAQQLLEKSPDTEITQKIIAILNNAEFSYNSRNKDLEYKVTLDADSLKITSIASGSKSFGILYLLLKTNLLRNDTIIVLDEPENHLHPEWQIKYAEILILLIKENYHIVLTSHSPTFIYALATYAREYNIDTKKVNFYLAEKIEDKNYSNLVNVNDNIEKIYDSLYSPNDILYSFYHD